MRIEIHENICESIPNCRLGCLVINNVVIRGKSPTLSQKTQKLTYEIAKAYKLENILQNPLIKKLEELPLKQSDKEFVQRSYSEEKALEILKGWRVHYSNSALDVSDHCSIKFMIPIGIYDLNKIEGDIIYKVIEEGQCLNLLGQPVLIHNKAVLADKKEPFGSSWLNSLRTTVNLSTQNLLAVIYADETIADAELNSILDFMAEMFLFYNKGTIVRKEIIFPRVCRQ